jgi:multidrug efflux pump subunit AcrA (membrane-fusion protein)
LKAILKSKSVESVLVEIDRIGSTSSDPVMLLSQAFAACHQDMSARIAISWMMMPSDQWMAAESYSDSSFQPSIDFLEIHLKPHLDQAQALHRISCVPLSSEAFCSEDSWFAESWSEQPKNDISELECSLLLLPIRIGANVKTILTFAFESDSVWLSQETIPAWTSITESIEHQLSAAIDRLRIQRDQSQSRWQRINSLSATNSSVGTVSPGVATKPSAEGGSIQIVGQAVSRQQEEKSTGAPVSPAFVPFTSLPSNSTAPLVVSVPLADVMASASAASAVAQQQTKLLRLAKVTSQSLDDQRLAYGIVNELQSYLGLGRIGLTYVRGDTIQLAAISGIETFDKRSSLAISLHSLCREVAKCRTPLWHPEQNDQLPSHLVRLLERYYESTDAQSIALLPLFESLEVSQDTNNLAEVLRDSNERGSKLLAILSIEGLREPIGRSDVSESIDSAQPFLANAICNSRRHTGIFLFPVVRSMSNVVNLFREHHRNKTIAVSAAVAILLAALLFYPSALRLKADGVIQPTLRSRIYAEVPGTVSKILVQDGLRVIQGTPLLQLNSPELDIEFERVRGEWSESKQSLVSIRDYLNSPQTIDDAASRQLRKERASLDQKVRSLETQTNLLQLKKNKLNIASPRDGQVITWDIAKRLDGRPVESGQHLMTIADGTGPWELELRVPDKLTGYLRQAIQESQNNVPISVQFVLASEPSRVHVGRLRQIADSQNFDNEDGSVLRVYVDLDEEAKQWIGSVKPGTEVIAHIHAGNRSLGFSLFFSFFDWLNRQRFKYLW